MASRDAIGARVEGLEEARRALEKVMSAERAALPEVLEVIGQQWTTEVRRRAPLLTGRLRRSYTYDVDPRGAYVELSSNVVYAPYQEFGTSRGPGRPHVRPGTEAIIGQVPALVAEGLGRAGLGVGKGLGGLSSRARISALATILGGE